MEITDALCGRTVEYVMREDNGGITLSMTCGRQVTLTIEDGQIAKKPKVGQKIILPGQNIFGKKGNFQ